MSEASKIVVVGLGYVGLPLAVALAEHGKVIGYDVDAQADRRVAQRPRPTREVGPERSRRVP